MIPELFAMLKSAKVQIKKEHQVLMVNKTTKFKKGKGKKNLRTARDLPLPVSQLPGRSQRMDSSLRLSAFITREVVTGSGTAPNT